MWDIACLSCFLPFSFKKIMYVFYIYKCFICMYVHVLHTCMVPARERQLELQTVCEAPWVVLLTTELGPFQGIPEHTTAG